MCTSRCHAVLFESLVPKTSHKVGRRRPPVWAPLWNLYGFVAANLSWCQFEGLAPMRRPWAKDLERERESLCVCMYMYALCICMHVHISVCTHNMCVYTYTYTYSCSLSLPLCVYIYIQMYACGDGRGGFVHYRTGSKADKAPGTSMWKPRCRSSRTVPWNVAGRR